MIFDSLILAAVTDELARTVVGGKVERVVQPTPFEIVLTMYHRGAKQNLLLSADPQDARVHLTSLRRDNSAHPPAFCMLLRKHLAGAWLTDAHLPLGFAERVLHLTFHAHDGARFTLIIETMGKHSNIILVNPAGTIFGAVKYITREINRFREIRPGLPYVAPPRQRGRRDPFSHFDPAETPTVAAGKEAEWLTTTFSGVSPLLAQEAVLRAKPPLSPETLWYGLNEILTAARLGDYAPRVWRNDQGITLGAYPLPLLSIPARDQYPHDSISLALDNAAASLDRNDTFSHARDALQTALHKTRKARLREEEETRKGLENAGRAEEYQQAGELLLANPHAYTAGADRAALPDYYAPPPPEGALPLRTVVLDPALDMRANAERYFKKARKARDSQETLQKRLKDLAGEILLLADAEEEAEAATTAEQVTGIRERISSSLIRSQQETRGAGGTAEREKSTPDFEGHKIKTFRSPDGWDILVGENAASNDYLTTRIATSSDIWLHVRAATSAHGVIRAQGRPAAVSPAAIQQAAELVAARSEVKHSSLIPVDYTLKKHVRKPRKSAPGAVTYQNEKTLYVSGI